MNVQVYKIGRATKCEVSAEQVAVNQTKLSKRQYAAHDRTNGMKIPGYRVDEFGFDTEKMYFGSYRC